MTRCLAAELAKAGEILPGEIVSREVEHGVLERTGMTIGEDEAITVDPGRVLARVVHDFAPEEMGHGGAAHRSARMAAVGRLRLVSRDHADGIDTLEFEGVGGCHG